MVKDLKDLNNLDRVLNGYEDLVVQIFQVGFIRELIKDYRHKRAEKFKKYNVFNTTAHVALENFYLLCLWKLFDEKRSKMSVYGICNAIDDPLFKNFFKAEIEKIENEIKVLGQWRNRIIGHRDISIHFDSRKFVNDFPLTDACMKKMKDFIFEFLCQLDFSLHHTKIEKLRDKYQKKLDSIKNFCFKESQLILKDFEKLLDSKKTMEEILPDVVKNNLQIIFCGMAAGKTSAEVGGYYAKLSNQFWDILYELNFTKEKIRSCEYEKILEYNIGLTDLVKNQSGIDLAINVEKGDIKKLEEKIKKWQPKILAFNGKEPAKIFLDKNNLGWGKQNDEDKIDETEIWVLPSTSGLNTGWTANNYEMIWKNLYQSIK